MKIKYTYGLIIVFCGLLTTASAQSDLLYSNLNVNAQAFNPAAIEDNQSINARILMRQQWVGFDDAPSSQWLNLSHFFNKFNSGLGINVFNQSAGAEKTQVLKLNYTYKFYVAQDHRLAFGMGAGVYFRKLDFSKLTFEESEEHIPVSDDRQTFADFDFGVEYTFKKLTIGLSSNHLTTSNNNATLFKIPIHNHLYASYYVSIMDQLDFIPGVAYHRSAGINIFDVSADFIIMDRINVGMNYRLESAFIIRAGIQLNSIFEIHYAYDLGAGELRNYNSGSHEFMVIARFKKKQAAHHSPRFF